MKILLTGRSGQVGWELERSLGPLGEVVAFDREGLDLADPDAVARSIRAERPDVIVNAAAYTAVDRAESEPELAMRVNADSPGVMAAEAKALGALVVHYSTDYVYDGAKPSPYTEDDPTGPLSVYGRSKLAGEKAIRESGCSHLVFRTSWVYGGRGKNFLLTMLRLADGGKPLRIVADQIGAPTWCRDIAEATACVLSRARARDERLAGLYHMTAQGSTSWYGFANAIFAAAGRSPELSPIPAAEYPLPAKRPANSVMDCARLEHDFGVRLPRWERGLRLCLASAAVGG